VFLTPVPITRENLHVVLEANWVPRERVCRGVTQNPPSVCR
jgi:D-xylose transport system substrate-binding protein